MSTLLPLFLILTTTLLPSTLAQGANANEAPAVAGTTTSYTLYNHPDTLTVTWGNKPIDPYALYGKTAYDFQLAIPHLAAHETYNASEQGWTDYCSAALPPTTGCVQLHIVPADENGGLKGKIDPGLLTDVTTKLRTLSYESPFIWTLEATFEFGPGGKGVGVGFVANKTESAGSAVHGGNNAGTGGSGEGLLGLVGGLNGKTPPAAGERFARAFVG